MLAQTLTSASPNDLTQPIDMVKIGKTLDTNMVSDEIVNQYLQWADQEIDGYINGMYPTPIMQSSDFETSLISNIDEYNQYVITDAGAPLHVGDIIILTSGSSEEFHVISDILDEINYNIFQTQEPIVINFNAGTRLVRIKYPDPLTLMSARLATASIYEKYFMAEASGAKSEYGTWLRKLVKTDIDNILSGRTILYGQRKIGRKFCNPNIVDTGWKKNDNDNKIGEL